MILIQARIPKDGEKYNNVRKLTIVPSVAVERAVMHTYKIKISHGEGTDDIYVDNISVDPTVINRLVFASMFTRPITEIEIANATAWIEIEEGFLGKTINLYIEAP